MTDSHLNPNVSPESTNLTISSPVLYLNVDVNLSIWPLAHQIIRNTSQTHSIIYRLKATHPNPYFASPTVAIIPPLHSITLKLCRRPFPSLNAAQNCNDKFLLLSAPLSAIPSSNSNSNSVTLPARWRSVPRSAHRKTEFNVAAKIPSFCQQTCDNTMTEEQHHNTHDLSASCSSMTTNSTQNSSPLTQSQPSSPPCSGLLSTASPESTTTPTAQQTSMTCLQQVVENLNESRNRYGNISERRLDQSSPPHYNRSRRRRRGMIQERLQPHLSPAIDRLDTYVDSDSDSESARRMLSLGSIPSSINGRRRRHIATMELTASGQRFSVFNNTAVDQRQHLSQNNSRDRMVTNISRTGHLPNSDPNLRRCVSVEAQVRRHATFNNVNHSLDRTDRVRDVGRSGEITVIPNDDQTLTGSTTDGMITALSTRNLTLRPPSTIRESSRRRRRRIIFPNTNSSNSIPLSQRTQQERPSNLGRHSLGSSPCTTQRQSQRHNFNMRQNQFFDSGTRTEARTEARVQLRALQANSSHRFPLRLRIRRRNRLGADSGRPSSSSSIQQTASSSRLPIDSLPLFPATHAHAHVTCPVCLESLREVVIQNGGKEGGREHGGKVKLKVRMLTAAPCAHVMHAKCLRTWCTTFGSINCPVCRMSFQIGDGVTMSAGVGDQTRVRRRSRRSTG